MTDRLTVANTILEQLGGRRFQVMTGAKNLVGSEASLGFAIMPNAKRVTHVRVSLNERDTYDVEFIRMRRFERVIVSEVSDVYCDQLRRIFTAHTGLEVSL